MIDDMAVKGKFVHNSTKEPAILHKGQNNATNLTTNQKSDKRYVKELLE